MARFDVAIVQNNLKLLVEILGEPGKVTAYKDLAMRLSKLAQKENVWSWRYVQSVRSGTIAPSKKFAHAVEVLVADPDGLKKPRKERPPLTRMQSAIRTMMTETRGLGIIRNYLKGNQS